MDSDDEEGPVVEGWSIFENSTDSSSSETTLGLDAPQSPIWEDRLESFLRRRRAFSVDHEAAATSEQFDLSAANQEGTCHLRLMRYLVCRRGLPCPEKTAPKLPTS